MTTMKDDLISRQAAIIQLSHNKIGDDDCDVVVQKDIETIKALPSAQPEKRTEKRTETHACDLIDRQAAIDEWKKDFKGYINALNMPKDDYDGIMEYIDELPSAQSEIKPIEYRDCANAMLKMWMDNVVTDGEYNRIMDKLNAHWGMENGRFNQPAGGD